MAGVQLLHLRHPPHARPLPRGQTNRGRSVSRRAVALLTLGLAGPALADVYAYVNKDGDYVVTPQRPGGDTEYAVLTDDGEFLRLVRPRDADVPVTHWRPWFLPREAHPMDPGPEAYTEREGVVGVEEVPKETPKR